MSAPHPLTPHPLTPHPLTTRTRRARSRRSLGALAAGAALATAVAPLATGTVRAADPPRQALCDEHACLLNVAGLDSDGDGVTDDDERALGTDPEDPDSHPPVVDVIGTALIGGLPSFIEGRTVVVGLPTSDRESSVAGVLGTIGAPSAGLDVGIEDLGKRLTVDGASALVGGSVGGMVKELMAAHSPDVLPARGGGLDPTIAAGGVSEATITVGKDGSSVTDQRTVVSTGEYAGELYEVRTERDAAGRPTRMTATVSVFDENLDGQTWTTVTEFDADGNVVSQTTTCTYGCDAPPPEEPKDDTPDENPDDGGDDGGDGGGDGSEPGDYPHSDDDTAIVYTNADEITVVITSDDIRRGIEKFGWNSTTTSTGVELDPSKLRGPGPDPLVALFDGEGTVVISSQSFIDYDRIGGNVTPGPAVPLPTELPNDWGSCRPGTYVC